MQNFLDPLALRVTHGVLLYAVYVPCHRKKSVRCGWQVGYVGYREPNGGIAWLVSRGSSPQSRVDHNGGFRGYVLCNKLGVWADAVPTMCQVETPRR